MLTWLQIKLFFMALGKMAHLDSRRHGPVMMLLTWFGSGYLKPASGTWGSLAALPFALAIHYLWGPLGLITAAAILYAAGYIALRLHLPKAEDKDPSYVVIDEVIGMCLALVPAAIAFWPYVAGFILFRAFDALKPGPIGWADRHVAGAHGVLLDDVIAGVFAAVGVGIIQILLWAFGAI